jgi:hypothetical protein
VVVILLEHLGILYHYIFLWMNSTKLMFSV